MKYRFAVIVAALVSVVPLAMPAQAASPLKPRQPRTPTGRVASYPLIDGAFVRGGPQTVTGHARTERTHRHRTVPVIEGGIVAIWQ